MSSGLSVTQSECHKYLEGKSSKELILELDYTHNTCNYLLERLILNEYYNKYSK